MLFIDEAAEERLPLPATERNPLLHAVNTLEAFRLQLGFPHTSAVQGHSGLRELRLRAGRSPRRAWYKQVGDVFVIAAIGPEAQVDHRRFAKAARLAMARLKNLRRTEMTKLSELRSAGDISAEDLADDGIRAEQIRAALAHAVALRALAYRVEHGLSQTALARGLSIEFHIDITPATSGLRDTA